MPSGYGNRRAGHVTARSVTRGERDGWGTVSTTSGPDPRNRDQKLCTCGHKEGAQVDLSITRADHGEQTVVHLGGEIDV